MKYACVLLTMLVGAAAMAQTPGNTSVPATSQAASQPTSQAATSQPAGKVMKFPSLTVDLTNRKIVMATQVCEREKPLELLVCRWNTKEHESILRTKASGAHLHAALLALGLTSGIPAHWTGEDEVAQFIPPRGPELQITLRWKDKDGKVHEAAPSDWIAAAPKSKAKPPKKWIFVGSDVTPEGTYLADDPKLGHLISVSNFADAVIDVPFESTASNENLDFLPNTNAIPPNDTDVEVIIQPLKDAEKSPYARVLLEIGPQGQLWLEGKAIRVGELSGVIAKFSEAHPRGQVVIRSDERAKVFYAKQAQMECRLGGVRNFSEEYTASSGEILPLTQPQFNDAMREWKTKFANPEDYTIEPGKQAADILKDIEAQLGQLDEQKTLWLKYKKELADAAAKYKASTQPAVGK